MDVLILEALLYLIVGAVVLIPFVMTLTGKMDRFEVYVIIVLLWPLVLLALVIKIIRRLPVMLTLVGHVLLMVMK